MGYQISIIDFATAVLQAVRAAASRDQRERLMRTVGDSFTRLLREHFRQREMANDSKRARKGWHSEHFWARKVLAQTRLGRTTNDRAEVQIASREFGAKLHGATITAPPGKALTIALRDIVYGKRARANPVPGLFIWRSPKSKKAYLASAEAEQPGKLVLYYRLAKMVKIPKDPQALPAKEVIRKNIDDSALNYYLRVIKRAKSLPAQ